MPIEPENLIISPFANDQIIEASDDIKIKDAEKKLVKWEYQNIKTTSIVDILTKTDKFQEMVKQNFFDVRSAPNKDDLLGPSNFIKYIDGKYDTLCEG